MLARAGVRAPRSSQSSNGAHWALSFATSESHSSWMAPFDGVDVVLGVAQMDDEEHVEGGEKALQGLEHPGVLLDPVGDHAQADTPLAHVALQQQIGDKPRYGMDVDG